MVSAYFKKMEIRQNIIQSNNTQRPKELLRTLRKLQKSYGNLGSPMDTKGTPRNPKELQRTLKNPKETLETPKDHKEI